MVKTYAATLVATGSAGFFVGGIEGTVAAVVAWAAVLIGSRRFRGRNAQTPRRPAQQTQPEGRANQAHANQAQANIDDVIDRLDDVARERNWDLDKRFDIARMMCEKPTMTIDELERLYDQQRRVAPDESRQDAPQWPKNDGSA